MCRKLIDRIKIKLHPDRCPSCGHTESKIITYFFDDTYTPFIEEQIEVCVNCKRIKNHWAYGSFIVDNWREYYNKQENKDDDLDDLPF